MAKYRRRPKEIEAFRYDGDLINKDGEYYVPNWAIEALHDGKLYYDFNNENEPPCSLYCCDSGSIRLKVEVGYYIVRLPDGKIAVCSEEYLNEVYELVDE